MFLKYTVSTQSRYKNATDKNAAEINGPTAIRIKTYIVITAIVKDEATT
jgi:hypothetical protein